LLPPRAIISTELTEVLRQLDHNHESILGGDLLQCRDQCGRNAGAYWNANTFGSDQYSQVESHGDTSQRCGLDWRRRSSAANGDMYLGLYFWNNGSPELMLFKNISNSWIEIDGGGQSTSALSAGTQLELLASGSTITFEKNGSTIFSITDTSLTGGSPGIATDGSPILDNWTGGISPSRLRSHFCRPTRHRRPAGAIRVCRQWRYFGDHQVHKDQLLDDFEWRRRKTHRHEHCSATLDSSSTWPASPASWTVADDNTNGIVTLTYATGSTPASSSTRWLQLDSITNPSSTGTYYVT